jgi:hypothetical protein
VISWFLAYLLAHLLLYVLVVRHRPWFRRELAILLFHAAPAAAAASFVVAAVAAHPGPSRLCQAVAVLSMQGIYSLSFLELWALADGGYSLHILARFSSAGETASALATLGELGAGKRSNRLAGLGRMGLIRAAGDSFVLTRKGRALAALLWCLARAVNLKQLG